MNELERAQRCAVRLVASDKASQALGITVEIPAPGSAVAIMQVRDDMVNGFNICHGGLVYSLADTAFGCACNAYDDMTVAAAGSIEYLRPAHSGDQLRAVAAEDHRGRRTGLYTVEVFNQDEQRIAVFRGRSVSRGEAILTDGKSDTKHIEDVEKL